MTETNTPELKWGYDDAVPPGSPGAWGARLIAPDDILGDRQDAFGAYADVLDRLNSGILPEVCRRLREAHESGWMRRDQAEAIVVWMDDTLAVVANTNGSHGYVYVAAFLFPVGA